MGDANVLAATFDRDGATTRIGWIGDPLPNHGVGQIMLRPEALDIVSGASGVVRSVEFYGHDTAYTVEIDGEIIVVRKLSAPRHRIGDHVDVVHRGGHAHVFPNVDPAAVL